ncbi:MAG: S41 family peptidase [Pirellulales bacterium]|nr:S41 family peptidase [Pirellulales bacterium]
MPYRNIRILCIAVLIAYACFIRADHNPYTRHVAHAFNAIQRRALYNIPGQHLLDGAIQGMVAELHRREDLHSNYFSAEDAAELYTKMHQSFGGIGIVISVCGEPPRLTIIAQPEPGSPAAAHNIRIGDQIMAIDGEPTEGLSMDNARDRMRGPIGTPVTLSIRHREEEEIVKFDIRRGSIKIDSVVGYAKDKDAKWRYLLQDDPRLAHVRITSFADRTLQELHDVVMKLKKQDVQGILLDLRNNRGGELATAVAVSDLFLESGQGIVSTKDRFGITESSYSSSGEGPFRDLRLVVLIDRNSASASEIVAACFQDNHRAIIAGERSFGKGTVQRLIHAGPPVKVHGTNQVPLLKLTTAKYWRPSGEDIHRMRGEYKHDDPVSWGVRPDAGFEVPLSEDEYLAYIIDRLVRDTYNPNGDPLPPIEDQPHEPFVDRAFELAVQWLQKPLKHRSIPAR